jgi:hypothetical protein
VPLCHRRRINDSSNLQRKTVQRPTAHRRQPLPPMWRNGAVHQTGCSLRRWRVPPLRRPCTASPSPPQRRLPGSPPTKARPPPGGQSSQVEQPLPHRAAPQVPQQQLREPPPRATLSDRKATGTAEVRPDSTWNRWSRCRGLLRFWGTSEVWPGQTSEVPQNPSKTRHLDRRFLVESGQTSAVPAAFQSLI